MGSASESIVIGATLAEVWDYYFEPSGWASWVDGFQAADSATRVPGGRRARSSGTRSRPGAARVSERVLEHSPRTVHRIAFEDPESRGELVTEFAIDGDGTRVTLTMDYELASGGPFKALTDRLFVRSQVERSLGPLAAAPATRGGGGCAVSKMGRMPHDKRCARGGSLGSTADVIRNHRRQRWEARLRTDSTAP